MKKLYFIFVLLFTILNAIMGQVGINADNSAPDQSAMLDVKSLSKGLLPPRMTFEQRNAINSPAEGLTVMCTNCTKDGIATLSIFLNGKWQILKYECATPDYPLQRTHDADVTQITWKWSSVPIATGYWWYPSSGSTGINVGMDTTYTETGLNCVTPYTRYVAAYNSCGEGNRRTLTQTTSSVVIPAPTPATHVPTLYTIVWNWNPVTVANGYKWNSVNDYSTATDMGTATSNTELGVNCGVLITRYVWSYNTCGISTATVLTQMSTACPENCLPVTDDRDGKTYSTVVIGNQCWMRENLNIGTRINSAQDQSHNSIIEKYCYQNLESNCDVYGGLYQWAEMVQYLNGATNTSSWNPVPSGNVIGICPSGYHIPSNIEWNTLKTYLGGTMAGGKVKETGSSHWSSPNAGATNESGFTALPGGERASNGYTYYLGTKSYHWNSDEYGPSGGCYSVLYYNYQNWDIYCDYNTGIKVVGMSIRCIKN